MRILFLTPEFPYPPTSGGTIKTFSILSYLKQRHEIDLLCFRRRSLNAEQLAWAARLGSTQTVYLHRGRNPLNLLLSYIDGLPLSIERNRDDRMRELVLDYFRRGKYDAVFVDHWLMAQYLPRRFRGVKALHEHNAEYVLWQRQAEREGNLLLRPFVRFERQRVKKYEAGVLRRFQTVFAVSEADREALIALGGEPERVRVLPNLPDADLLGLPPLTFATTEPIIFYFGTLSWQPNIEGLEYLLRAVFPLVRKRFPPARLLIAGRGPPDSLRYAVARTEGAELLGPIEDPEPLFRRARVFVEISRSGGGTRLKVLNAMARGLPVVASPEGAGGLEVINGVHLLVEREARPLAEAIVTLMQDEARWRALSENGRELIRSRYVAEKAFHALDDVFGSGEEA